MCFVYNPLKVDTIWPQDATLSLTGLNEKLSVKNNNNHHESNMQPFGI